MSMKTEKQKMLDGELYVAADPQLTSEREYARRCVRLFNQTTEADSDYREKLLKELFGSTGENINMEPNIRCDYGYNIHVGKISMPTSTVLFWMFVRCVLEIIVFWPQECIFTQRLIPLIHLKESLGQSMESL